MTDRDALRPAQWKVIAPGIRAMLPIRGHGEEAGLTWTIDVDLIGGRVGFSPVIVGPIDADTAIAQDLLRRLPLAGNVASIVAEWLVVDIKSAPQRPDDLLSAGPTAEALRYVAHVYRLADVLGQKPTQAVAELGLTRPTAERWVRAA